MIAKDLNDIQLLHFPSLSGFHKLNHFVTTRKGGVSTGNYQGLNLGNGGDDPQMIAQNQFLLSAALGTSEDSIFYCHQTHSANVRVIDTNFLGLKQEEKQHLLDDVDAMVTNLSNIHLIIRTADCVPVLLFDPKKKAVAAIHAGWRGTVARIACKALEKMQANYGSDPRDVLAAIGPSISPDVYEVGPEVCEQFQSTFSFSEQIIRKKGNGKYMLDLWQANTKQLLEYGVLDSHIELAGLCTLTQSELFYSARRDGVNTGRMGTGISLVE
ncbi:MAG: peptidoglycan editing factor PgeF [Bacteroidota bacterium]|nr:peptidoglycan editing factor PgeF [Bacteroidota bacterium]